MYKESPKVAIIIVTINSLSLTLDMLGELSKLDTTGIKAQCVVVDNNSIDLTKAKLEKFHLPNMDYKFIENDSNLGYAGGNNMGIKFVLESGFDYVVIMNNDLVLPRDLLKKLVGFMEKHTDVGISSPKIYFANGYEFHKDRYSNSELGSVIWYAGGVIDRKNVYTSHRGVDEVDKGQYENAGLTEFANGACMIVRSSVFEKIGILNENYFLYWEDVEFSTRAMIAGIKVYYAPITALWHKVSVSTGGSGGEANDYYLTRNRYFYALKYSSFRTKMAVIKDTIKLMIDGRKWQRIGAKDALLGRKGIGSWTKI